MTAIHDIEAAARRTRVRRTVFVLVVVALASYSLLFVMAARA